MIPKKLEHNGELFTLNNSVRKQTQAKSIGNKIKRKHFRFRIKYIDNKYCIYKEVKGVKRKVPRTSSTKSRMTLKVRKGFKGKRA